MTATATMTFGPLAPPCSARRSFGDELVSDQRGAVMLTGLFMSCFLIGALWFVVGIGDTVVFRDKMQEAADVGAFSSAALHAKGMNFISLCNLVMLVGTVIHLVLGIISDVKFALMVACAFSVPCWPAFPAKFAAFESAYNRWDSYFSKMSKAFKAIHTTQKVASYAYPAMGVVEAYQNGAKYGGDSRTGPVRVLAVSSSLVPGGVFGTNSGTAAANNGGGGGGGGNAGAANSEVAAAAKRASDAQQSGDKKAAKRALEDLQRAQERAAAAGNAQGGGGQTQRNVKKEGLPVEAKNFDDLCKKVVSISTTSIASLLGAGKSLAGSSPGGKALSIFNSLVGKVLQFRYCNSTSLHFQPFGPGFDSFWGEEGPYVVYGPASNGNIYMQSWAINISPKLNDTSESRVGIAAKQFSKYTKQEGSFGYFAQAEMYFDCDAKWDAAACNFEDGATYAIKWRARMRRLELPAIASGAVGMATNALLNLPGATAFKNAIPDGINDVLGTQGATRGTIKILVDKAVGEIEGFITGKIGAAAGNLDPTLQGLGITSYH